MIAVVNEKAELIPVTDEMFMTKSASRWMGLSGSALREAGFFRVTTDRHRKKPWMTVLARK
ncbi:MAG TPA: hypothetical protein PKH23_01910 [Bacillota bacterium]|nr:hypothetical protein [Bacillota bacterium]